MAGQEENQNLALVPVFHASDLEQDMIHINKKQVLSASFFKHAKEVHTPFYRFVQQPTRMLVNPMDVNKLAVTLFLKPKSSEEQIHSDGDGGIQYSLPSEGLLITPSMNNEIVVWKGDSEHNIPKNLPEVSQLPFSERKKNWIIRRLQRADNSRSDSYYVHLQTDKQFRSLTTAHAFVAHGRLPERRIKGKKGEPKSSRVETAPPQRVIRGDYLLDRVSVGYYNLTKGEIFRSKAPGRETTSATIGNKRKRKEDALSQEVAEAISAAQRSDPQHLIYPLYDFEPLN